MIQAKAKRRLQIGDVLLGQLGLMLNDRTNEWRQRDCTDLVLYLVLYSLVVFYWKCASQVSAVMTTTNLNVPFRVVLSMAMIKRALHCVPLGARSTRRQECSTLQQLRMQSPDTTHTCRLSFNWKISQASEASLSKRVSPVCWNADSSQPVSVDHIAPIRVYVMPTEHILSRLDLPPTHQFSPYIPR